MSFSKPIILVIAIINNKKKSSVGVILINVRAILINVGAILMGVILQWGDLTRYPTSIWGIIYPLFKYDFDIKIWYFVFQTIKQMATGLLEFLWVLRFHQDQ
jgi:hypothetical protein